MAAFALALTLAGCGLFGDKKDPRKDWTAAEYYKAAKEEFDNHNWDSAIKLYEQLESKFPYGRFAQQAQIEAAYAYYKQGETAQAVTALEKFVKLHPNHQNVDYALYLKALANFKEDLGPFSRLVKQDLAERDPKAARESPSRELRVTIPTELAGLRLDQALAKLLPEESRSRLAKLIEEGHVRVDGAQVPAKRKLKSGESVEVALAPRVEESAYRAEAIALDVVHEDDDVMVLDKPAGLV
ncbi:MAG TPA: outer membrane protein assembly factor BamD, partial [Usitatibacter sp.]|nr:outer membrane protein assembly factor BamD [Usitatibacter sp.]